MTSADSANCLVRLVKVIKEKPDLDVFSGEHYAGQLSKENVRVIV
ncbi:hypothetical protein [Orrella sp. 11846]